MAPLKPRIVSYHIVERELYGASQQPWPLMTEVTNRRAASLNARQ
jgi:hypothetical protein